MACGSRNGGNKVASVSIRNVQKKFGDATILHGVSVDVADGEFVVLVGPSGCGKSTLLRMIAGLEDITAGEIAIDGTVVNKKPPKERDISMVFQNYALYPHMTVAENMAFSLTLAKAPAEEKRVRVAEAAEILGLAPLLERYPRQLSGGQRQRVAMGRSIVRKPKVFLFDEPLSNLDAKLRVAMRGEIKALHKRLGTTMVYVTHDQVEAMTMADRIVVMQAGRIEQLGDPMELYDRPVNMFVAQFIGSPAMNVLKATRQGDRLFLADGSPAGLPAPDGVAEGRSVLVGKRPEHVVLVRGGEGIPARVKAVEPTGSETYSVLEVAGQEAMGLFRDRVRLDYDETVRISLTEGPIHFFDPATGLRMGGAEETRQ